MDQNLMIQEISDKELEQIVGGHCYKPRQHKWCEHHFKQHCYKPEPSLPHFRHHCEPPVHCHVEPCVH
jgi:bacteriocin-like protein